jgi:hypothetical protein
MNMKSLKFIFTFVLISWMILVFSCRQKKELLNYQTVIIDTDDCFPQRKMVEVIANVKGEIINLAGEWLIQSGSGEPRFFVCNIPEALKTEGFKLIFDAEVKEIYPNERWIGTPAVFKKALILTN